MTLIFLVVISGVINEATDWVILCIFIGIISLFFGVINFVLFRKFTIWNKYPKKVKVEEEKHFTTPACGGEPVEEVNNLYDGGIFVESKKLTWTQRKHFKWLKVESNEILILLVIFLVCVNGISALFWLSGDNDDPLVTGLFISLPVIIFVFWYVFILWVFRWISKTAIWRFISESFRVKTAKVLKEGKELDRESKNP